MKVKDFIRHLQDNYPNEEEICGIIWTGDDVQQKAKKMGFALSDEDVTKVLNTATTKHDANVGVSYETIETIIRDLDSQVSRRFTKEL